MRNLFSSYYLFLFSNQISFCLTLKRTLVITFRTDLANPKKYYLMILNLITSAKSLLSYMVIFTGSEMRTWIFWGTIIHLPHGANFMMHNNALLSHSKCMTTGWQMVFSNTLQTHYTECLLWHYPKWESHTFSFVQWCPHL